ncbi:hypothetical protein CP02DC21_0267B, partial [Chlamydia psittaci 02DC21]
RLIRFLIFFRITRSWCKITRINRMYRGKHDINSMFSDV